MDKAQAVCVYKHTHTMKYYSTLQSEWNNAICSNMMDLEIIILSEVRQRKTIIIWYPLPVES